MADDRDTLDLSALGQESEAIRASRETEETEIEREIDALVAESGSGRPLSGEHARPRRSGRLFPILLNVVAAAAIVAAVHLINSYFETREEAIVLESRGYFSAEAQLIEQIIRDNQERLAQKDAEINDIQGRLAEIDREKQNLEANLEAEVAEREAELRRALEAELELEQRRLADAGTGEQEIRDRLAELEQGRRDEIDAALDQFRTESRAEVAAREADLTEIQARLEQTLAASREERARLAREAADREAAVRAELGAQIERLQEAEFDAQSRLIELQRRREEDALLTDRVLGSFAVIVEDIGQGNTDEAIAGLDALDRLLAAQPTATEALARQRRTERALASTLRSMVQEVDVLRQNLALRALTSTPDEQRQIEQERAADLIDAAVRTVALAEEARSGGRFNDARTLYQQALATIPSLERVYPGILELESERRRIAIEGAIRGAADLLETGSGAAAVDRYADALVTLAATPTDPLVTMAAGLGAALAAAQAELLAVQEEIEADYRSLLAARDRNLAASANQLSTARSTLASAQATAETLRGERDAARRDLAAVRADLQTATATIQSVRRDLAQRESDLAASRTALAAAQTRSASLQESLTTAQARVSELEARLRAAVTAAADAEARAAEAERQLAARPAAVAQTEVPAASRAELEQAQTRLAAAERELAAARTELAAARAESETLRADLSEADARAAALQGRVTELERSRTDAGAEADALESRVTSLAREVDRLTAAQNEVAELSQLYQRALTAARAQIERGDYRGARSTLLAPFAGTRAVTLFPSLVPTLESAGDGMVRTARTEAGAGARGEAFTEVVTLARQVQQNIDRPQDAAGVSSYLRRFPDLSAVANELFAIVELSSRAISAVEVEYKLLGSISRVTGSLIIVERLVALPAAVGDTVEIRRAPQLGQEVSIARGTILEVADRRVVVDVSEIYQIDLSPSARDLVYIAQR